MKEDAHYWWFWPALTGVDILRAGKTTQRPYHIHIVEYAFAFLALFFP